MGFGYGVIRTGSLKPVLNNMYKKNSDGWKSLACAIVRQAAEDYVSYLTLGCIVDGKPTNRVPLKDHTFQDVHSAWSMFHKVGVLESIGFGNESDAIRRQVKSGKIASAKMEPWNWCRRCEKYVQLRGFGRCRQCGSFQTEWKSPTDRSRHTRRQLQDPL